MIKNSYTCIAQTLPANARRVTSPALALLPGILLPGLLLSAPLAHAEITEIPPEEMTEAYIRDTTVIVREAEEDEMKKIIRALITVFPIDETYSEGDTVASDTELAIQMQAYNQLSTVEQQQYLLEAAQQLSIQTPDLDQDRHVNDEFLRQILGLEAGAPIDYSNLQFPTGIDMASGNNLLFTEQGGSGFQLTIQNSSGYAPTTFATPGGEIGVSVTPDNISISINTPGGN